MFVGKGKMARTMLEILCIIAQNLVDQVPGTCAPLEYHLDDLGSDKDDMEPTSNECG
jgi:hypothetical protein